MNNIPQLPTLYEVMKQRDEQSIKIYELTKLVNAFNTENRRLKEEFKRYKEQYFIRIGEKSYEKEVRVNNLEI